MVQPTRMVCGCWAKALDKASSDVAAASAIAIVLIIAVVVLFRPWRRRSGRAVSVRKTISSAVPCASVRVACGSGAHRPCRRGAALALRADLVEHGQAEASELSWILAHGEMPELRHDRDVRARNGGSSAQRILRRAGEVVFAGQQIERAGTGVDGTDLGAKVAVDAVEIEIALEHAGAALPIHPQRLVAGDVWALRRDQARDQRGADLPAVHVGPVEPGGVVPWRLEVGGLEPDQGAEHRCVFDREIEHDPSTDRATHHHRAMELERAAERDDHLGIGGGGEAIFLPLPALGRQRFAVPGHVEGEHAIVPVNVLIQHQVAELPPVGAGRVQAEEGDALARLLEIDPVRTAVELERQVAANDGLELRGHAQRSTSARRGSASRSLTYCRLAISGCRSPSSTTTPFLLSANRSCQPGCGTGCQNRSHASAVPRTAKRQLGMTNGPRANDAMRPAATVRPKGISPMPTSKQASKNAPRRMRSGSLSSRCGNRSKAAARRSFCEWRSCPISLDFRSVRPRICPAPFASAAVCREWRARCARALRASPYARPRTPRAHRQ